MSEPTNPKDPASHPNGIYLINLNVDQDPQGDAIGVTAPAFDGPSKVIGDPFAVQSGVQVTVVHYAPDGVTEKERISVFSRIDGSFEAILHNSAQGDKVEVFTTSLPSMG